MHPPRERPEARRTDRGCRWVLQERILRTRHGSSGECLPTRLGRLLRCEGLARSSEGRNGSEWKTAIEKRWASIPALGRNTHRTVLEEVEHALVDDDPPLPPLELGFLALPDHRRGVCGTLTGPRSILFRPELLLCPYDPERFDPGFEVGLDVLGYIFTWKADDGARGMKL